MKKVLIAFSVLVLASCAQLGSMASYSVSEADLEQMLAQQVPKLSHQATAAGIPLTLQVDNMKVDIGPDNSDLVRLDTSASAVLSLFGLSYPATMSLLIEAAPYYDAKQQAVFLRSVNLLSSSIDAAGYRGNLKPVNNELLSLINSFLADNPVYRLDTSNPSMKLLSQVPLNMAVQSGSLRFSPSN
ncbi:DUF1439 domain-containing protein [Rheinheimera sp. WS51]|uniref:DUF1439 domain-containing protein n=1 Tax=Rheinheimera sp. WS51 TaxID=3425886 RepID=UPI003D8B1151